MGGTSALAHILAQRAATNSPALSWVHPAHDLSPKPGHLKLARPANFISSGVCGNRIYTADDLDDLFRAHGFEADDQFDSAISFTRDLNADYRDLIDGTPPEVLDLYDVGVDGDRAALTFDVLNVRFVVSSD